MASTLHAPQFRQHLNHQSLVHSSRFQFPSPSEIVPISRTSTSAVSQVVMATPRKPSILRMHRSCLFFRAESQPTFNASQMSPTLRPPVPINPVLTKYSINCGNILKCHWLIGCGGGFFDERQLTSPRTCGSPVALRHFAEHLAIISPISARDGEGLGVLWRLDILPVVYLF